MQVTDRHEKTMNLNTESDLLEAIEELNRKKELQENLISASFNNLKEDLSPKNIAKSLYHKITDGEDIISLGLKVGGTIAAVILSKKIISHFTESKDEDDKNENHSKDSFIENILKTTATNILLTNIPVVKTYLAAAYENLVGNEKTRLFHKVENNIND